MRAIVCSEFGPPENLREGNLPEPKIGKVEVLIDVKAAGVSFADTLMIRDLHQNKHAVPFAPGMEVAGYISEIGEDVEGFSVGQRVMALVYDGGYAVQAKALQTETFCLPDKVPFEIAAGMCSVYLTAHCALAHEARLKKDEKILILGAAGGVGLAAVEVAKAMGAFVIAAAGSREKTSAATERGADAVINYSKDDLRAEAISISENGVDVVFDPVAGIYYEPAFRALDWGGRYLTIGYAGGAIPQVPANLLLVKNRSALGFALMHYRRHLPNLLNESAAQLLDWVEKEQISPRVDVSPNLSAATNSMRAVMDRKAVGKFVLKV